MTFRDTLHGALVLAPMTKGSNLPYRQLCQELGARVTVSEMTVARRLKQKSRREFALIRRFPGERFFGVQLAGNKPEELAWAAALVASRGADFIDVNLGCPIDDATRRGFGAALLERASRVAAIVAAMKQAVTVPVTVKLRLGWSAGKPTFLKVARAAEEAGADAISLHARSRAQRYRRPAEWPHVAELAAAVRVPVIGNGDIFSWRDAERRRSETGCAAVMVGRWALAKPWIFREFAERRDIEPDAEGRLAVLRRYVEIAREHFGDDERGRARTRRFLVFHQDFFRRYRPGGAPVAVNSDDPREWGAQPRDGIEEWLCRGDLEAAEALCRWLVDGGPAAPPPAAGPDAVRAVSAPAYG